MDIELIQKISALNVELLQGRATGGAIVFVGELQQDLNGRESIKAHLRGLREGKSRFDLFGECDMGVFEIEGRHILWRIRYFNNHMNGYSDRPWCRDLTRRILYVSRID
jgi:hypothetical protein